MVSPLKHPSSRRARLVRALRWLEEIPGWHRVVDKLVQQDPTQRFVIDNRGIFFEGNLQSHIERELYLYGGYEESLIELFLGIVPHDRRNTIFDVGANIGTHSLRFARQFQHVHAFEPYPPVFDQLKRNLELNGVSNVTLHPVGLADRKDVLDFHLIDKPNSGLGTFSTVEQYDLKLKVVGQAPIERADDYMRGRLTGPLDAVKIDVQGFEPEGLRGMRELLAEHRPFVWFEVTEPTLRSFAGESPLDQLIPYKFDLFRFDSRRSGLRMHSQLTRLTPAEIGTGDFVAVPAS